MEVIKGLYRDINKNKLPHGNWFDARNIVISEKHRDGTNEKGFTKFKDIDGLIIGIIPTNTKTVIFSIKSGTGEINVIDEQNNCTCVLKSADLNFSIDNPIEGVFTYNNKQELIIAWWDGLADDANPPKALNVDCLPFEVNGSCEPIDPSKIVLLQLFPNIGCADFTLEAVTNTGGNTFSGAYAFVYAYILDDGTASNYTGISNWVPIIKDLDSSRFVEYDGDPAGTFTSKAINLKLNNINLDFDRLKIGVIKKIGGVLSAVTLETVDITSDTYEFTYNGLDLETDISLTQLLTPTSSFTRVKTGTLLDSRLHLANLKQQAILDYQPYANNIKVKWVRTDDVNLALNDNSYKDPIVLFDKKGYASDAVYAPIITFKFKDGSFSRGFHIPNTDPRELPSYATFFPNDLISDINASFPETRFDEALLVDPNARFHEFFNDALATGEMGYWENQDEVYPDEDCSDIKNSLGNVIGTLRNKKYRHHKFPAIHQLNTFGNPFYTPSSGSDTTVVATTGVTGWVTGSDFHLDFDSGTVLNPSYFTLDYNTDGFSITAVQDFEGFVTYQLSLSNLNINTAWRLIHRSALGSTTLGEEIYTNNLFNVQYGGFGFFKQVSLKTGDTLIFSGDITGNPIISFPNIDSATIKVEVDNTSDSDGTSKILGFKLEDVHIPDEIKDVVDCYYIGYAKRSINNITKVGQTRVKFDDTIMEFSNFDIKLIEPPITPSYIKPEYNHVGGVGNLLFNTPTSYVSNEIRFIENSSYFPSGIVTTFEGVKVDTRAYKSSALLFKLQNALTVTGTVTGSIYQYKKNLYSAFRNQEIVLIPKAQDINNSISDTVYGGDVVINIIGFFTDFFAFYPAFGTGLFQIDIHETASVVGYRYADTPVKDFYSPRFFNSDKTSVLADVEPNLENYAYNLDYNSLNELVFIQPAVCYGDCDPLEPISDFPYRIARSPKQPSEAKVINWRKFFTNDYHEMGDRDKGEIWKIQSYNRALLIYQKYAMFAARPKDLLKTDDIAASLGEGDIFDRKPDELAPDDNGYAGNQSQWATFVCKHGVVHIDSQQGKIFIFSGELREISNKGLYRLFYGIRDKVEKVDNPFKDSGWVASFDEEYNRLLVTKLSNESITLSYSFDNKAWTCFHDYHPNAIFYTRNFLISVLNDITLANPAGLFEHNIDDKFGIFHDQVTIYPAYIEPIYTTPAIVTKLSRNITWQTRVKEALSDTIFYDETFTHILVYNDDQCSGVITLINGKNLNLTNDNIRNAEYTWKFNKFRDIVINRNELIVGEDGTINTGNLNINTVWFHKSKFFSKFIAIRLIYDNINQHVIDIQDIGLNAAKSKR